MVFHAVALNDGVIVFARGNKLYKTVVGGNVSPVELFASPKEDDRCTALALSEDMTQIAVHFSITKQVHVLALDLAANTATSVDSFPSSKRISELKFNKGKLFYSDGWGEVVQHGGSVLLGHVSLLNGFLFTEDGQHVVSWDRDEKVRVSHFPNGSDIESYCLGHQEWVSGVAEVEGRLLSCSGDATLRLWTKQGVQITATDAGRPVVGLAMSGASGYCLTMDRESGESAARPVTVDGDAVTVGEPLVDGVTSMTVAPSGAIYLLTSELAIEAGTERTAGFEAIPTDDVTLADVCKSQWKCGSFKRPVGQPAAELETKRDSE